MGWLDRIPNWLLTAFSLGGALVVAFASKFPDDLQVLGLTIGLVILGLSLLALAVHIYRDWNSPEVTQEVVDRLAELRSYAIHHILNARPNSLEQLAEVVEKNNSWILDVQTILRAYFPKAVELGFMRLGVIQPRAFPHAINNDHTHLLSMFSKRLGILEQIIEKYPK